MGQMASRLLCDQHTITCQQADSEPCDYGDLMIEHIAICEDDTCVLCPLDEPGWVRPLLREEQPE